MVHLLELFIVFTVGLRYLTFYLKLFSFKISSILFENKFLPRNNTVNATTITNRISNNIVHDNDHDKNYDHGDITSLQSNTFIRADDTEMSSRG